MELDLIMKTVLVLLLLTLMVACAPYPTYSAVVAQKGAEVSDQELITARWLTCEAATVGAIRRKYANDPVGLAAWRDFCSLHESAPVTP
jgi:hypothetical protein